MAHHHSKSVRSHEAEQQKEFKISNAEHSDGKHKQEALSQAKSKQDAMGTSSKSLDVDEGGGWQFKFLMGAIAAGVLMLILKTIGLF